MYSGVSVCVTLLYHSTRRQCLIAPVSSSHPEDWGGSRRRHGCVGGRRECERERSPRLRRLDDPVVPEARCRMERFGLGVKPLSDLLTILVELWRIDRFAALLCLCALHLTEHSRCLLASHDADARVRPDEEEARRVGAATHAVIARAKRSTHHHGELGHLRSAHCGDELRAVLGDSAVLRRLAHHEAGDVLEEEFDF